MVPNKVQGRNVTLVELRTRNTIVAFIFLSHEKKKIPQKRSKLPKPFSSEHFLQINFSLSKAPIPYNTW